MCCQVLHKKKIMAEFDEMNGDSIIKRIAVYSSPVLSPRYSAVNSYGEIIGNSAMGE